MFQLAPLVVWHSCLRPCKYVLYFFGILCSLMFTQSSKYSINRFFFFVEIDVFITSTLFVLVCKKKLAIIYL